MDRIYYNDILEIYVWERNGKIWGTSEDYMSLYRRAYGQ